jgi:hypothetical protein
MTDIPRDPQASGEPEAGAPGASPAGGEARGDPAELLVRAISSLPPADRDRVYLWLLRRQQITVPHTAWAAQLQAPVAGLAHASLRQAGMAAGALRQAGMASGQQMVPVRFSSEQHAQLREWCAEHGFSMATVIRGLVTRFLEGQSPPQGEQSPT